MGTISVNIEQSATRRVVGAGAEEGGVRRTNTNHSKAGEFDLFTILPDDKRWSTEVVVQYGSKRIVKSWLPTFLTVVMTLSLDADVTLSAGVERDTSRPPMARAAGVA